MNESCFFIFRKQSIIQSFKLNLYGLGKAGKMFTFCVYQQVVLNYCWSMYHALQAAFFFPSISVVDICCFAFSASAVCFFWQHNLSFPWGTHSVRLGGLNLCQHRSASRPVRPPREPHLLSMWLADLITSGVFLQGLLEKPSGLLSQEEAVWGPWPHPAFRSRESIIQMERVNKSLMYHLNPRIKMGLKPLYFWTSQLYKPV